MFKKFDQQESITGTNQVKTSVHRAIKKSILEKYPALEGDLDVMYPKKQPMYLTKCKDHLNLVVDANGTPWFFNERDGPYFPTLRTLHQYPDLLPRVQVDKGAIKFVMRSAEIMCPGLTSPGGEMKVALAAETPVAIYAEGKVHALGVGMTKMSTEDITKINKGTAIANYHHLGDGLWHTKKIET